MRLCYLIIGAVSLFAVFISVLLLLIAMMRRKPVAKALVALVASIYVLFVSAACSVAGSLLDRIVSVATIVCLLNSIIAGLALFRRSLRSSQRFGIAGLAIIFLVLSVAVSNWLAHPVQRSAIKKRIVAVTRPVATSSPRKQAQNPKDSNRKQVAISRNSAYANTDSRSVPTVALDPSGTFEGSIIDDQGNEGILLLHVVVGNDPSRFYARFPGQQDMDLILDSASVFTGYGKFAYSGEIGPAQCPFVVQGFMKSRDRMGGWTSIVCGTRAEKATFYVTRKRDRST